MAQKDLIPLNLRTPEERRAISSKGGKVHSEKKSFANAIKNLKHGRYSKFLKKRVLAIIQDSTGVANEVISKFEDINKLPLTPSQKIALYGQYIQGLRLISGDKVKIESRNLNINTNVEIFKLIEDAVEEYESTKPEEVPKQSEG